MITAEKLWDLNQELLERLEIAQKEALGLKMNPFDVKFPFVHVGDKEYVNPNYLSFEDHFKIVHLCKLVKANPELTDEDLTNLLNTCKGRFELLIEVNNVVPNLIEEIRAHEDEKHVPYLYFGLKQNKENNINV